MLYLHNTFKYEALDSERWTVGVQQVPSTWWGSRADARETVMLGDGRDQGSGFDHHATTCTVTAASLLGTKRPVRRTDKHNQDQSQSNPLSISLLSPLIHLETDLLLSHN